MSLKHRKSNKSNIKLTRKQQRKVKRQEKKIRRNEYYTNRKKPGQYVLKRDSSENLNVAPQKEETNYKKRKNKSDIEHVTSMNKVLTTEELRNKEQKEQKKIQKQMTKQRSKQLLEDNIEEDRIIKQLEKQLKLNKRKSKAIPKKFAEDGLDYLLEVCDSETMKSTVTTEQELNEVNDEFEEDFSLMTAKTPNVNDDFEDILNENDDSDEKDDVSDEEDDDVSDEEDDDVSDEEDDDNIDAGTIDSESEMVDIDENEINSDNEILSENQDDSSSNSEKVTINKNFDLKTEKIKLKRKPQSDDISEKGKKHKSIQEAVIEEKTMKRKNPDAKNQRKKVKLTEFEEDKELTCFNDGASETNFDDSNEEENESITKENLDGTWEDIYGRLRAKDGNIIIKKEEKYVPPAIRAKLITSTSEDKKRLEKMNRLKKQLKGLLNRLACSNMHNIASQIEELYMNNSRNDMNETLTNLMVDSLISQVITPERLLMEHVVLITILHANVGTEVGAHFLQVMVKNFDDYLNANHDVENKLLDNTVNIISQLYNFKLFDAKLLYEILHKLSKKFEEKDVECILNILKSVGFTLRKDDPLALKDLILDLQKQAVNASEEVRDNPRVKFMLDILLAIKNNNVTKIPNYDTSYSEHLKKIMKGFIRKGNYITQLSISLDDLLKADERGKWWVVGSAWTGNALENTEKLISNKTEGFSEKLLKLARKQRMNTDTRRNIFCIIMSAEDYLDAFEKLLRLGLRNQQEREIINVILHCCLQEKVYNPYYAVLAQKFCEIDRKYQMTIKCSIWDKLKSLDDHSGSQISNLAKMLTHLFLEKGLPISTLKIVQFGELDKVTLRFMRQILLGILLHEDEEACLSVFEKIAQSDKLKLFRESLRLFIHHFLLRNLKSDGTPEKQKSLLENRAKLVERVLILKEHKMRF